MPKAWGFGYVGNIKNDRNSFLRVKSQIKEKATLTGDLFCFMAVIGSFEASYK